MSREGVDYAWHGRLDTTSLRAASVTFAMRYLSTDDPKLVVSRVSCGGDSCVAGGESGEGGGRQ